MKWTKEQEQVIALRGCHILVSAAAGSGKTAVLVQRILSKIMDEQHPVDIDRLLIMTFTRAAAGEMRERICTALEEAIYEDPDNEHLQRQMSLLHTAQITTIDGFCAHIIRNYFHLIELDPGYRIADEGEIKLLQEDVLDELLEKYYQEKQEDFLCFAESYSSGKSDERIRQMILDLYYAAMSHPDPQEWLQACLQPYQISSVEELAGQEGMKLLWEMTDGYLEEAKGLVREAGEICRQPGGPYHYEEAVLQDADFVEQLQSDVMSRDYESIKQDLEYVSFARLSNKKASDVEPEKKENVKQLRDDLKRILQDLGKTFFAQTQEEFLQILQMTLPVMKVFVKLVRDFHEMFSMKKREKNLLDFTDMEHLALEILMQPGEHGREMSQAARELSEKYEEVLVDEYQDSNLVQEILANCVSGWVNQRKNIFMVGDVKQSIYRFRLARPELFMEKYKKYSLEEGEERRIDLHKNFRSRPQVLECVNYLFRQIMGEDLGGISYDDAAALYPGADFPDGAREEFLKTEVLLIEKDTEELQEEVHLQNVQEMEALAVAHSILQIVGKEKILDKKTGAYRPAEYGDIAILLRTAAGWTETFQEILLSRGIPAYSMSKTGYFSALEIVTILDFLRICDNPLQDIPLAGILYSPIVDCSAEEMALVRSAFLEGFLYEGVCQYAEREELETEEERILRKKLQNFLKLLEQCRSLAVYTPIHQLIQQILKLSGYGDYARALPGGEQRSANLHMLVEKAMDYEKTSYRGLFHFVRYIESLQKYEVDFGEVNLQGTHGGAVQIMTIHKSKGLEFPIVYVAGLGKNFNFQDMNAGVLIHPELGLGADGIVPEKRLKIPSLYKQMIRCQMLKDSLGEELRILYVALTRAKEKLILSGSIEHLGQHLKNAQRFCRREEQLLPVAMRMKCRNYWGYLLPALASHPCMNELYRQYEIPEFIPESAESSCAPFEVKVVTAFDLAGDEVWNQAETQMKEEKLKNWDPEQVYHKKIRQELEERFHYQYPHGHLKEIPVKVSVSELNKRQYQEESEKEEALFYERDVIPLIPRFMAEQEDTDTLCPAMIRGSAYHCLMEWLDYSHADSQEQILMQMENLQKAGKMQEHEAECISVKAVLKFISSPLGQRMRQAAEEGRLYREQPFMILREACAVSPEWPQEEQILIQGIMDAYFAEGEELVLVDYKTDRVFRDGEELLRKRYGAQLEDYAQALEQTLKKKVKEKVIYSFSLNKSIYL